MSSPFFTNTLYDKCNLDQKQNESVAPFNWITDRVRSKDQSCFTATAPFMNRQLHTVPASVIDTLNDLQNRTRPLSRCQAILSNFSSSGTANPDVNLEDCTSFLVPQNTRDFQACNTIYETPTNRFELQANTDQFLNHHIHLNGYIGVNTRLQVKDAFTRDDAFQRRF